MRVATSSEFPAQCIDGRPSTTGAVSRLPRTAGGTLSIWVAQLLLSDESVLGEVPASSEVVSEFDLTMTASEKKETLLRSLTDLCELLVAEGLPVSDHFGEHTAAGSGCGAADNLARILEVFSSSDAIAPLLEEWGLSVADIPASATLRARAMTHQLPDGHSLVGAIDAAAQSTLPVLAGAHSEIAVIANGTPGTTVDGGAVGASLERDEAQVFAVDTWAFANAADHLLELGVLGADADVDRAQIVAVIAAFNAATLLTLCAPTMPTVYL